MSTTEATRPRESARRPVPVGTVAPDYELVAPLDPDPAGLLAAIGDDDRAHHARARDFVENDVLPVIADYWDRSDYPLHLVRRAGELDLLRDGIAVPGLPPMSKLAAGLITMEVSRGDGSMATVIAVQGGLAMRSIDLLGSDAQKQRWLDPLARGLEFGAFALTEPTHGSDSVSLETTAHTDGDEVILTGHKKWIGNGSVGGVTVVWARGDDGQVHGYLVDQATPGYTGRTIERKSALRAIWQAEIELDGVRVPASHQLPGGASFADTSRVLLATRLGVAWSALGHATACYETAVHYARQRIQFGRPLAASQIVQERLARMLSELATMQLLCFRMSELDEAGTLTGTQASLAKYTCTRTARGIAANARDLLGGNGILLDNRVARHMADLEAIHTYEGTETMQALIIGRSITGVSAFV